MTLSFRWRVLLFLSCVVVGHAFFLRLGAPLFLPFFGVGSGLLWWLARAPDDQRLRRVVLASFWVRAALGTALYALSSQHWPVLRSLQVQDGFWTFALDARLYHEWGVRIAEAWRLGIELPDSGSGYDYFLVIAAIYRSLGAHLLYAILVHCWCGALTGWLAYRIGERLFDRPSALRAAVLVGFWPSSLLWSSQLLRDVLTWCLTLAILWLVALVSGPDTRPLRARVWRRVLQAAALAGAAILLTRLRVYLGSILVLAALVTFVPAGCGYLLNRQVGQALYRVARLIFRQAARAIRVGGVAALVIGAVVVARDLDTTRLVSPAHPEYGHVRLGLQHQSAGGIVLAEAEFRRAIDLRPDYQPAYLLWAGMLSAAHRPQEALAICASWPGTDADGAISRCASQLKGWLEKQAVVAADSAGTPSQREHASAPAPSTRPPTPDRLPPTAPTTLQARAFSSTQITLTWATGTDNAAVTDYRIFRDGTRIGTTPGLNYQDTGLTPNTPYTYTVVAVDAAGNVSAQPPAVKATTPRLTQAPVRHPTGLLAHWPLDDRSGTIATEASDQHPHGRLQNGPRWIRGRFGVSLSFDGADDYVDAGPIPPLTANFTIAGWVYRRADPPSRDLAMWCSQGLDGENGWAVYVQQSGGRVLHGFLKGGVAGVTSDVPSARETWEHVAWVVDAQAKPSLYLNGILVAKGVHAIPIRPPAPGIATYLGADQSPLATPGRFFPGVLDDVRLYHQVLTAAAIADLAQVTVPATQLPQRVSEHRAGPENTPPEVEAGPVQLVRVPQANPASLNISAEDVTEKTPPNENTPPEVEAGPVQIVRRPQTVVLRGEVRDDGQPTHTLTYQWTQMLGPPVRFATPNALETAVQLPERARYRFRLTASDGTLTALDEVSVTVEVLSAGTVASRLANQGLAIVGEMSPQWLGSLRGSVILGGGNTLVDARTDVSQPLNLMTYLPRALLIGFLAPFPWQWFDTSGGMGGMRIFAGLETALVYLLLIGLVLRAWRAIRRPIRPLELVDGAWRAIRRMPLGEFFLLLYGLVLGASMSLVMANLGTLFRLRLLFWLPLLIPLAAADPLGSFPWYRRLVGWIARRRGTRRAPAAADQHGRHAPVGEESDATAPPEAVAGARGEHSD